MLAGGTASCMVARIVLDSYPPFVWLLDRYLSDTR